MSKGKIILGVTSKCNQLLLQNRNNNLKLQCKYATGETKLHVADQIS